MSGFNFGGTGAPTGGFTFGTAKTATTTPATGFSFSTSGSGGFNFGAPTQPAASAPATGLFSLTTQAPATQTTGFSFGTTTPAAGGSGFSLGINTPKLNLSNAAATPAAAQPGGFGLGSSTLTNTISSTVTSTPATLAATGAGATQPAAPAPTATTTSAGPTLFASLATAPTSSTTTGLALCAPATTAGASGAGALGFSLKAPGAVSATSTAASTAATTTTSSFALNLKPLAPAGIPSNTSATVTAAPGPIAPAGVSASPVMTYAQLESLINKWSLELEDQERHFLQQATQVNAWDRTLIENGEKITSLHREVEKVKLDQKRLDQELDFILSQQKELEDLLSPLEESVKEQSGTVYLQHADEEREKTYKLAENIDAQLKRMAQDLKDIIEHLNTSGGPADTSDPLQQICKILNAHMDSLQWIDQNSALLQRKVEEVTKVCEGRRKEQERSFRITFD
nr:PREDICTED: nuclear pore glycoprotein p62 [Equus przewalskii]